MQEAFMILPYPSNLSVNKIWQYGKNKIYLNPAVKNFRKEVYLLTKEIKHFEDALVQLEIKMYPPDARRRDVDNILKVVLDSLQYARLFNNDHQVYKLSIEKMSSCKKGKLEVKIALFVQ